jgi:signal recognition particle subunit SRP54
MGEKLTDLEQFYPDRMASRILGMGDVESLIEKAQNAIDEEKAKEMEQKLKKASFDFNDMLDQFDQLEKMGGMNDILKMLPGFNTNKQLKNVEIDEGAVNMPKAIIYSMTPQERSNPDIINPSRKKRIADGAGVPVSEVNKLLKQFEQSKKMMKQMSGLMGGGKKRGGFKMPFGF